MFVQKVQASALLTSCGYIFAASQAIKSFRRGQSSNQGQVLPIWNLNPSHKQFYRHCV